jgi:hypothetical protein
MQAQSPGVSAPTESHAFSPALTWNQVQEHEARTDIGIHRRIMLATATFCFPLSNKSPPTATTSPPASN